MESFHLPFVTMHSLWKESLSVMCSSFSQVISGLELLGVSLAGRVLLSLRMELLLICYGDVWKCKDWFRQFDSFEDFMCFVYEQLVYLIGVKFPSCFTTCV